MSVLRLQRFLVAIVAASPMACSSTGSCGSNEPSTHIYSLALLADAGPAQSDAGAGTCQEACERLVQGGGNIVSCQFTTISENGKQVPAVDCRVQWICEGRRPEGFCAEDGEDFAIAAQLEAASVFAFAHLAHELRHHRAPRRLIAAARRSRRDELRHARATRALARREREWVPRVTVAKAPLRDLETIAIENAVEGCVRETFGAATAWARAMHASDPVVRAAYQRIARDETKHAALSFEIDRWVRARLSRDARARVEAARKAAVEELRAAVAQGGGAVELSWVDAIFRGKSPVADAPGF